ncbi:MAG: glycosyltransferase [Pseudomonadota bacterium]
MLKVTVVAITYARPDHLAALLESFLRLEGMEAHDLTFVVVDNDAARSAERVVAALAERDARFVYVPEPKKGIPVARNRGLDEAIRSGSDVLCFVDDDEVVDPKWLAELLARFQQGGAEMVGGPVLVGPLVSQSTRWQRLVHASLAQRARRKALKTAQDAKTRNKFTIVTNNWLADLAWLTKTGVRFDEEKFRYSGGSDTAFYRAFKFAGGKGAWNPNAVVYETVMSERLSLSYQMRRGRAQSANHYRMKHKALSVQLALSTVLIAMVRFILGAMLLVVPVFGMASPVMAVRSMGWALGRIDGMLGTHPALYEKPETS